MLFFSARSHRLLGSSKGSSRERLRKRVSKSGAVQSQTGKGQTGKGQTRSIGLAASFFGGLCLSGLFPLMMARPAVAAEEVILTYGFAEISTSVEALRIYARTGQANEELSPYIRYLSEEQQAQFRQALQAKQEISPVNISQFLHSGIGENILRSVGNIIQTKGRSNGAQGLRGALVLAAAEPEGLSLLSVLDYFPSRAVRIDSGQALRGLGSFTGLIRDTQNAITAISRRSVPAATIGAAPTLDELSAAGPYQVTQQMLEPVDLTRDRLIPTDLYLPVDAPPAPVIIFSHGLAGDRKGFVNVSRHLASHGYAIAALDHPGSNRTQLDAVLSGNEREIATPGEFRDRPLDVSFLLDELTRLNAGNSDLIGQLDLDQVGIIGHSFGGYTALALAGAQLNRETLAANCASDDFIFNEANPSMLLQCTALLDSTQFTAELKDERIKAVIALNPVTSSLFGRSGLSQIDIPSLIISGTNDPVAPALLEQVRPFTWLSQSPDAPAHFLALIRGGSHLYEFPEVEGADPALASGLLNSDLPLVDSYLEALTFGFFQAELNQNAIYQEVLDNATIVQIGRQPIPLYLVNSLSADQLRPATPAAPTSPPASPPTAPPAEPAPVSVLPF
ncbi:alpha/beta hydrolase [cf. Phormidesmis sp. LEGE 11477]|uniref:alpha/beta hydrolase n=1 Tax=cf. Phormidesmis sp. LEGE 11477 TaxID=1828680 RepID=UPI00187E80CE|nr:alpha/beta hydrolase [cf. Phormidesmis sp. LEGE 11477]MBE9064326.1 alpha/beta hydrolase [cf. Phormidesmis sp. LEGE 11477]